MHSNRPSKSQSMITECDLIRKLFPHCNYDSTLIFDLDNTILRPWREEDLGSDQWFKQVFNRALHIFGEHNQAHRQTIALNRSIQALIKVKPVEPTTPAVIKRLQDVNLTTLAVTARGMDLADITFKQLADINIEFTKYNIAAISFEMEGRTIHFVDNVLFCSGVNKGKCLVELQQRLAVLKSKVIMLDDTIHNLEDVRKELEILGVDFTGLRYSYLDERVREFNLTRANVKLASVSTLFSQSIVNIIEELQLDSYSKKM